eukprot:gene20448-22464_t
MTTGVQVLADILEVTNAATKSVVEPAYKEENLFEFLLKDEFLEERSNSHHIVENSADGMTDSNIIHKKEVAGKTVTKKDTNITAKIQQHDNEVFPRNIHGNGDSFADDSKKEKFFSDNLDTALDASRAVEMNVPNIVLKEHTNIVNSSSASSKDESSSEIDIVPKALDNIKVGVFVSSGNSAMSGRATNASFVTTKPTEAIAKDNLPHKAKISGSLVQGDSKNPISNTKDEVMAMSYPEGQKKNVLQEQLKNRMLNAGPVKKRVMPRIIQSTAVIPQNNGMTNISANQNSRNATGPNHVVQSSAVADSTGMHVAVATSAAIAPFLQIQNALESQISSLVQSITLAHSAKEQIHSQSRSDSLKNLEQKLVDGIDKRMSQMEELQSKCLQNQLTLASRVEPQEDTRGLGIEPKGIREYHRLQTPVAPDSGLQLIPTKDTSSKSLTTARISEFDNTRNASKNMMGSFALENKQFGKSKALAAYKQDGERVMRRATSRSVLTENKSTSPFIEQLLKRSNANAKTQTSSAESSIISEESLLETPLPRSKIPVPFSKYTPTGDKRRRGGEKSQARRVVSAQLAARNTYSGPRSIQTKKSANTIEKENLNPDRHTLEPMLKNER